MLTGYNFKITSDKASSEKPKIELFNTNISEKISEKIITQEKSITNEIKLHNNININNNNTIISNDNILVKYDSKLKKFKFKNNNNVLIGSFSVEDIFKYISGCYDLKGEFLSFIPDKSNIINKFICTVKFNNKIHYAKLTLLDYSRSEFMGDIEMLMILNKDIDYFFKNVLNNELEKVEKQYREDIRDIIEKFNILIIHYTIKLISQVKSNDKFLKGELVNYSIGLTYRLTNLINNKITSLEEKQTKLISLVENSTLLKNNLDNRINNLNLEDDSIQNTSNTTSAHDAYNIHDAPLEIEGILFSEKN